MSEWLPGVIQQELTSDRAEWIGRACWRMWRLKPVGMSIHEYFSTSFKDVSVPDQRNPDSLASLFWGKVWAREAELFEYEVKQKAQQETHNV